jgi:hypothetical protein
MNLSMPDAPAKEIKRPPEGDLCIYIRLWCLRISGFFAHAANSTKAFDPHIGYSPQLKKHSINYRLAS